MPSQALTSKPGRPDSANVGISGAAGTRDAVVTATLFSLPPAASGRTLGITSIIIDTCPPIRSVAASAPPRYGTWTMSMPAMVLNSSPARCDVVPLPADAKKTRPGLARA